MQMGGQLMEKLREVHCITCSINIEAASTQNVAI